MNDVKLLKITRSEVNAAYVINVSKNGGETWERYDMYPYGGVPTAYSWDYDEDSVTSEILSDIASLVNEGYMFATTRIEKVE